ncbi:MAG TPA: lysoplasmalogenase [Anaerolineae bacterium]|nr:lysoplasmalogenase [Anaerolineae bacterium]
MAHLIPIPFLVVTASLLVRAEFKGDRQQTYFFKPVSTVLVIGVALLSFLTPNAQPAYTLWITLGLVLSLGGDVALMFESGKAFLIGLVLFLLAHVVYAVAFTLPNSFHAADLITAAVLLVVSVPIYLYLKPGLGDMKGPVIFYIVVIGFMVNRAVSTFFGDAFSTSQAWLISLGAVLFWLSDLVLAVNRFRHPFEANRLSLFLYYGGQLLIALSPSYFV